MISHTAMIRTAMRGAHRKQHHAAFVFRGGALVAAECNSQSAHAEARALAKLWIKPARRLTLLSVRVTKDGHLKNAFPCEACMALLRERGVKTLLWSTDAGTIEKMRP